MDSNRVKRLATGAREALRNEVSARLDAVLVEGSRERLASPSQIRMIEKDMGEHSRDEVVDRAAYTWFNRLCALRFMDANGYTPTSVVTPRPGSTQPAILADAAQGVFDPEYGFPLEVRQSVAELLSGSAPSDNAAEDAYSLLLRGVCVHYARPMGYLFSEDVASSLLMPQGLLAQGSILARIVEEMDEEACSDVEVLGWFYQFYIAERKDQVFAAYKKGKKAQAADIAPATQLFTPDWIVRYMTENSLGRLWMLNNPDSELASAMDYYIAPEADEPHIEVTSADEILVLDPACGSGHILVYAFDLLFRMYEEEGWPTEDIPQMIIGNNLFGLEIDRRAAEIASFALEMKARERDPRFLEKDVDANIRVLEPVELLPQELELVPQLAHRKELLEAMSHLNEVGSLYVPDGWDEFTLQNELEHVEHDGSIFASSVVAKLRAMLENVRVLSKSYHCVIANPPYMGSGNMNPRLSGWIKANYPEYKSDLFSAFISRNMLYSKEMGELGFMTPYVWMFISSYEHLRKVLIEEKTITSLIQLEYSGFAEATVPVCTFTVTNQRVHGYKGGYVRLSDFVGAQVQAPRALEAIHDPDCGWFYRADAEDFKAITGWPISYWVCDSLRKMYSHALIGSRYVGKEGVGTRNDSLFLRLFWEVSSRNVGRGRRWLLTDKAGGFRKWYLGQTYVMDWEDDGFRIKNYRNPDGSLKSRPQNLDYLYRPGVSWGKVGSGTPSFRIRGEGFGFNDAAPTLFGEDLELIAGFLNCSVMRELLKIQGETLNLTTGIISGLPLPEDVSESDEVRLLVKSCVAQSRSDWDAFETSWTFTSSPLIGTTLLSSSFDSWAQDCSLRFDTLKANEEKLNRIFARIYHMEGEVPIEVPEDKVSVRLADRDRDARALISYGVGCMFGRYSTEADGLVLADQGSTLDDFRAKVPGAGFFPDEDNVLPVLSDEWFEDDIVTGFRAWLAHAFCPQTVDENVAWLEESIGKDLRTYFCRDFYADHLKTYQKRPIYWMFQSPKKSFQCLVYLHRYDEGTVGAILTGYLRQLQDKLRSRVQALDSPGASARDMKERDRLLSQVAELEQWEREVIYPLAHERVSIDLDDGVKVNYNKFPKALAKVPGLSEWK